MHAFLRAIGFSSIPTSQGELEILLDNLFHTCDERKAVKHKDGKSAYLEYSKSFGPNIGIRVSGEMDGSGYHRISYFPYLIGTGVTSRGETTIEQSLNGERYLGMTDESKVGVSLIYHLQNAAMYKQYMLDTLGSGVAAKVTLSALSVQGKILLPMKNGDSHFRKSRAEFYEKHEALVNAAKQGSEDAVEGLTFEDMETYAMISRRLPHEDIYSIVDSSFIPLGLESDHYEITGSIMFYAKVRNDYTKEYLYQLTVDCSGLQFDVCINEKDLFGDPEIGRRFKGTIWLQGRVGFN